MRANKHLAIFFFFILSLQSAFAQEKRFVYIQSDQQQSFYVRSGNQIYSSTDAGYVIIPDLNQGIFKFTVGFPKNTWGVLNYSVEIGQNDKGFRLAKVDSTSWVLFDYQTSTYLNAKSEITTASPLLNTDTDDFTNILEEVSNASLLQRKNAAIQTSENKSTDTTVEKLKAIQNENKVNAVASQKTAEHIEKTMDWMTDSGRVLKYKITNGADSESVMVFIAKMSTSKSSPEIASGKATDILEKKNNVEEVKEKGAVTGEVNADSTTVKRVKAFTQCGVVAEEKDFLELRRKMVKEDTEAGMLVVSEKAFANFCYTKSQIRNLAVLFINEENRLAFLKSAYPYCYDAAQYETLLDLLSNKEKADELRALIR